MKWYYSLVFVLFLVLLSCDRNELVPRTNPRFSVTFVQEISEKGVEFEAQMYDYGNEEILEYGFVFSNVPQPKLGNSDRVRGSGKPEKRFKLTADFGMVKGRTYFVSAFLVTNQGEVYSQPIQFTSQGSEGFIFESVTIPEPFYLGDTVTFFGRNHSQLFSNYRVLVNDVLARVTSVDPQKFRVILPDGMRVNQMDSNGMLLNFSINIAGKQIDLSRSAKMREPEFANGPIQEVFFSELVTIRGKYLYSERPVVYLVQGDQRYELPIMDYNSQEIKFYARVPNGFENFEPMVVIRDKEYLLGRIFRMKGSELIPNQRFQGFTGSYYELQGQNFLENPSENRLVSTSEALLISTMNSTSTRIGLNFGGAFLSRKTKVYAENYGQRSTNFAEFTFIDAALRHMQLPAELAQPSEIIESGVTGSNGFGYFFFRRNVYQIDPITRSALIVATAPISVVHIAGVFSYSASNGKIYLGAVGGGNSRPFFEFDPLTNRIIQLANLPVSLDRHKLVHYSNGRLYIEGGYRRDANGFFLESGVYRYDPSSNDWTKINRIYDNRESSEVFRTFQYKGNTYAIDRDSFGEGQMLVFDPQTEVWNPQNQTGFLPILTPANEYYVIGDWVYSIGGSAIQRFNPLTGEVKSWHIGSNYNYPNSYGFHSQGKIYLKSGFGLNLMELDPEYFDLGLTN